MKGVIRIAVVVLLCYLIVGTALGAAIHPPFVKTWEFRAHAQFENYIKSQDVVYFGTYDSYGAVDLRTGRRLWETTLPESVSGVHVAFDGKTLFAAAGQWKLVACEPKTGKARWSLPLKGYSGPMVVAGGVLYCEIKDGVLTALDTRTRKSRWSLNLEPRPLPKKSMRNLGMSADPLIIEGRLFVGTNAAGIEEILLAGDRFRTGLAVDILPECEACGYRYLCGGGCRAERILMGKRDPEHCSLIRGIIERDLAMLVL